jgi:hypothetical protein
MKDFKYCREFLILEEQASFKKTKLYFQFYDFDLIKDKNDHLIFIKKASLFQGWKWNPLDWESEINIKLSETKKIAIHYTIKSNGFLTPIAFSKLYIAFLSHLEKYLTNNENFELKNSYQVLLAKKKVFKYHIILLCVILAGLFMGNNLSKITGISLLGTLTIIIVAVATQKIMSCYFIKKYKLKQNITASF